MIKVILFFFFSISQVFACSCISPEPLEKIFKEGVDVVMQGEVITHVKDKVSNYAIVRITKTYLDKVRYNEYYAEQEKIHILESSNSSASCGLNLQAKKGTKFLLTVPEAPKSNNYPIFQLSSGVNICDAHLFGYEGTDNYKKILKLATSSK